MEHFERLDAGISTLMMGRSICFIAAAMIGSAAIGAMASEDASSAASSAADQQNAIARQQMDMNKQQWDEYQRDYEPLNQQVIADSKNYDSVAKQNQAAGQANADVVQAYTKLKGEQDRQMAGMGVNPNSGKFVALNGQMGLSQALADAGAQNTARQNLVNQGAQYRLNVMNMGKGIPQTVNSGMYEAGNLSGDAAKIQDGLAVQTAKGVGDLGNNLMNAYKTYQTGQNTTAPNTGVFTPQPLDYSMGSSGSFGTSPATSAWGSDYSGGGFNSLGPMNGSSYNDMFAGTSPGFADGGLVADRTGLVDQGAMADQASKALASPMGTTLRQVMQQFPHSATRGYSRGGQVLPPQLKHLMPQQGIPPMSRRPVAPHGMPVYMDTGGAVPQGPGTTTSDSIPARLSNGEYVINANAVKKVGTEYLDKINQKGLGLPAQGR